MQAAFLFELAIKATVVIAAASALAWMLSRASAAARSGVWAAGLAFVVALPLFIAGAPAWSIGVLPASPVRRVVGALVSDLRIDDPLERRAAQPPAPAGLAIRTPGAGAIPGARRAAAVVWPAISIAWLLGTLLALLRMTSGLVAVRRISAAAEPLVDREWAAIVTESCAQLGVRRAPRIGISGDIDVPAICGVLSPTLLLPRDCRSWSDSCRRVVVLHELAHLQRRDCLIQLLADCASAMYWFHPLVRRAAARLRHEREQACDDVVIQAGTPPATYADHLLDLVRAGVEAPPAPAMAFGTPSRLNQRIRAILDDERRRSAPSSLTVAAAVAAGCVGVAAVGGVRVLAQTGSAHVFDHGGGVVTRVITVDTRQRVKDALAAAVRDSSDDVRGVAVAAIAAIEASGDAPLTVETPCGGNCVNWADSPDALVQAMRQLEEASLVLQLVRSEDVEVRRAAVGRVWPRTQRGAAALAQALVDTDRIVRNGAAIRLDSVFAQVAVPNWIALLADTDPMLRERASISLGVIGDPRAIDPLGETLRDPEGAVRLQAARALAAIALGRDRFNAAMAGGALQARTVFRPEEGVTLPEVVREVKPDYTPAAVQARIQGGVVMRAIVEADGSVKDVEVVESLDTEHGLDKQATDALKQYQFKPGLWMGAPVPVLVTVEMRFRLR